MLKSICSVVAILFLMNALLHLMLIFGLPLGEFVLGGKNKILPFKTRIISFLFLIVWVIVAISYFNDGKLLDFPIVKQFDRNLIIIVTIFLFCTIFTNGFLTGSKKEQWLMTPFSIIGFVLSSIIIFW